LLKFRKWLTAWSVKSAQRQDESEKNRCAAQLTGSTRRLEEGARRLDQAGSGADPEGEVCQPWTPEQKEEVALTREGRYVNQTPEQKEAVALKRKDRDEARKPERKEAAALRKKNRPASPPTRRRRRRTNANGRGEKSMPRKN
jgi:hypothetical protein